jgi:hypothetical protein
MGGGCGGGRGRGGQWTAEIVKRKKSAKGESGGKRR